MGSREARGDWPARSGSDAETGEIPNDLIEIVLTIHALGEPTPTELCFALERGHSEDDLHRDLQNLRRLREFGLLEPAPTGDVSGQRCCYRLSDRGLALAARFGDRAIESATLRARIEARKKQFVERLQEDLRRRHVIDSDDALERIRSARLPGKSES